MKEARIEAQILKGFQDYLPGDMIARQRITDAIRAEYERFGFVPVETPIVERREILTGSAGLEINKEIFTLETPEEEGAALRFDLTVPFARLISQYRAQIKLPFRRYHIGPVFRADKPGPGRFRQFTQCDIDIAGARNLAADAEVIAVLCAAMRAVGLTEKGIPLFRVRISNRQLMDALLLGNGISDMERIKHTLRVVDKLQKIGLDNVRQELGPGRVDDSGDPIPGVLLPNDVIEAIVDFVSIAASNRHDMVYLLDNKLPNNPQSAAAIQEMNLLAELLDALGITESEAVFDPSLTRGLDYYTGPVFEIEITSTKSMGSVGGGGRYNELCNRFLSQEIPAVGASIGLDRLLAALGELGKMNFPKSVVQVCIATVGKVSPAEVMRLSVILRSAGLNTLTYLGGKKNMAAQLSDADRYQIPVAVILGEEELSRGEVSVKDLVIGKESRETIEDHEAYRKAGRDAQVTIKREALVETIHLILQRHVQDA